MQTIRTKLSGAIGFTLTEFLVLIGVGSLLAGVLLADLTQIRARLLQQACAANLRQWAMAIDLYTKDFDGAYFHSQAGDSFDDAGASTNRYWPYLGGGNYPGTIRNLRICPAVAVRFTQDQIISGAIHSYSIPIPQAKFRGTRFYRNIDTGGSPWYNSTNSTLCPSLRYLPNPSQFLLLMESRGNNVYCGGLILATTTGHVGTSGDLVPAIERHGGNINCLFGDFHVELVSTQTLASVDASGGCSGSTVGNPWFNMN